jgi:beta-lactamase superfamily II metal-dependent hydrolase
MTQLSPPAEDEIEVTIFGRGYGESCVVHVGHGRWVIVDSYNHELPQLDPAIGRKRLMPVARWYLDQLGVPTDGVEMIVCTHFHKDHYVGLLNLLTYYSRSRLVVTAALKSERFLQLFADEADEQVSELAQAMKLARRRVVDGSGPELRYWGVESGRPFGDTRLSALAPMQAAVDAVHEELAKLIDAANRAALTDALNKTKLDENCCSVVLHVDAPGACALLCADLPTNPHRHGWQAVIDERAHAELTAADYVKVPHHGSEHSDHPPMWDRLVETRPTMSVTPYWPSGLPRPSDCERLAARGPVFQAAPSRKAVSDPFGNVKPGRAATGIIQARRRGRQQQWHVEYDGAAFEVALSASS